MLCIRGKGSHILSFTQVLGIFFILLGERIATTLRLVWGVSVRPLFFTSTCARPGFPSSVKAGSHELVTTGSANDICATEAKTEP